ncbi:fatty acyl-AMP ligase [Actinokineospora xionganensis]|uniref:Fatty acyl-AMP ligase n=1 Tax=Actinokineospora xionganensis TaxID=2684470 RepID=A0ABR7L475_9PSEU|nr:fatty acyl-AMP ligase [Actinokineospora xionganensis]MBC6447485.1 fatty acyl-AMP ligase [Actinokineospora xionganensis]
MTALHPRHQSIVHALVALAESGSTTELTMVPEPARVEPRRYDAVFDLAARSAAILAEHGVGPGDRILICLPAGWPFAAAFFGAQVCGAAPASVALPTTFGATAGFDGQLKELVGYLRPAAIVTTAAMIEAAGELADTVLIDGDALVARAAAAQVAPHPVHLPGPGDLAFIQLTSGSTGAPKGVMVSHGNLITHLEQLALATGWSAEDVSVSWLPLYHDMGLVAGLMLPIYTGGGGVVMPPTRFLRAPAEWLHLMSHFRGTTAAAPNFAYGYLADRVKDEHLKGVDLSSWRMVFCGAEPINPATIARFTDRFTKWGLRPNVVVPCYGMAEAVLGITMTPPAEPMRYDTIDRQAAVADARVVDVEADSPHALRVVDCGAPVVGTDLRIVDDQGTELGEGRIGHIQFRGPSRTVGYFDLPRATAEALDGPGWWKTGDVGYLRDGSLRITGRAKDLVIIRGANYFPSDFEQAAETVHGVRLGGVVAVGYLAEDGDSEELHLVVETELEAEHHDTLRASIRSAVSARTGVPPIAIHMVPRRSIPKTTSGKVQRSLTRGRFVDGWTRP